MRDRSVIADLSRRTQSLLRDGRFRGLLQGLGAAVILAILAYALYRNRDQFQQASFSMDYTLAAVGLGLWASGYLLLAFGWTLVLNGLGNPVPWWHGSRVWLLSQGLKYIPGSVVYAFGRVVLAQEAGIRAAPAAMGLALESLLALATALLVFLVLFPLGFLGELSIPLIAAALLGLAVVVASLPPVLTKLSGIWAKTGGLALSYRRLAFLCGFYIMTWFVVGLACYVSLKSLGPEFNLGYLQVLGLYAVSWAAGLVAVFAPGGVGVRDGLLILLLSHFVPLPLAAMGAAVLRVQTLVVEGVLAFVALKLQR
ncbi:MAG: lysylphosphatidylglycerol synthase domain-containing protein [Dehalococcoidia bacterium]|nr:lysylphosphatidylglycerol synthase domain-containing protein [Dehalococcoidia bacterium]